MPGRHTDAGAKLLAGQIPLEFAGGLEGVRSGVVKRNGCPEHRQGRIALELVNHALVAVHHLDNDVEEVVQRSDNLLRCVVHGVGGGADDVDEQHRHLALLAAELRDLLQRLLRHLRADVLAEDVAHALPVAQPPHHLVEPGLQHADFGAVVDVHLCVLLAAAHAVDRALQLLDRVDHAHDHQRGAHKTGGHPGGNQRDDRGSELADVAREVAVALRHRQKQHAHHRHGGGGEPRQVELPLDRRLQRGVLEAARQRGRGDGAHEALGLQVGQHGGDEGGQRGGGEDDGGQAGVDTPSPHSDDRGADTPHAHHNDGLQHRQPHDQVAHHVRVVPVGVALPFQHGPEQVQRDHHAQHHGDCRVDHADGAELPAEAEFAHFRHGDEVAHEQHAADRGDDVGSQHGRGVQGP